MKRIVSLAALTLLGVGQAFGGELISSYTYSLTTDVGTAVLRDLEFKMNGGYTNDANSGWGLSTSFYNNQPGGLNGSNAATLTVNYDAGSDTPFLTESLFFGIIQGLPQDIADGNANQKHLVLFLDPVASLNIQNIAFGTVFTSTNEDLLINAIEQVHRDDLSDAQKAPYYESYIYPFYDAASNANAGSGAEPKRSIYFGANSAFDIMMFSNGQVIGSGTSSSTLAPVPEPATCTVLGVAMLGLLRRRRSA